MKSLTFISLFVFAAMFAVPTVSAQGKGREGRGDGEGRAHFERQHAENEAFRQTLKDMEPGEAIAAIKAHRTMQFQENLIFFAEMKEQRAARINGNERLSDDQKAELISFLEVMHAKRVDFFTKLHERTIALLDRLAAKENLTRQELHKALEEHAKEAKADIEEFREEQRQAWREKFREIVGGRGEKREG